MKSLTWWKILCIVLLLYTVIGGFLIDVPKIAILNESIRNLYFHVPMWFGMMIIFLVSVIHSIRYLRSNHLKHDTYAIEAANIGTLMGCLGITTGMLWASVTWGYPWSNDPKQTGAAIALLIYFAYFVLRASLTDEMQKARFSAVYNIFAFSTLIPLLYVLPRLTNSLHPGSADNPSFATYDLDNRMRLVFYPAVIGWTLLGWWIVTLRVRVSKVKQALLEREINKL